MLAQNWMVVAFIAPMLWALVNLIDLFLAKEVFADEEEAAAIIGIFGLLPWISIIVWGIPEVNITMAGLSIIGGLLFAIYTFYYFRSLFVSGDATLVMIMINVSGLTVPLMAAMLMHERLTAIKYLAIIIVVIGSVAVGLGSRVIYKEAKSILKPMTFAIIALSLSMVAEGRVYQEVGFRSGLLFFSLGIFLGGVFFCSKRFFQGKKMFRFNVVTGPGLVVVESINLLAVICSQYAIKISPSVSYVATIETTLPTFIILFSLIGYGISTLFGSAKYVPILTQQLSGYKGKLIAIIVVAYGVYLLG